MSSKLSLVIFGFVMTGSLLASKSAASTYVDWTMLPVNEGQAQADSHSLKFPDGTLFFIDMAYGEPDVVPYLKKNGIKSIDAVILSHMHKDHYGGLVPALKAGIKIKKVYLNVPPRPNCDNEKTWGCDYLDIEQTLAALKRYHVPRFPLRQGDFLYRKNGVSLKVLYAYDGLNTPIGKTDVNDMSAILQLKVGESRALFTGDLNAGVGKYLASNADNIAADILKVPHHGTESVAPNEFFDRVGARLALVPSPKDLWKSARSERIRKYFESKPITLYVNGIDGQVDVRLSKTAIEVSKTRAQVARVWQIRQNP